MKRLFNILLSVFRALIIVFSLQLILLAVSTILGYSPNTVLSKLYNIIGLDFFFILSKASGVKGLLSLIRAFSLLFSLVSLEIVLFLFKLPINSRRLML